jgi:predicted transcriptional regulator
MKKRITKSATVTARIGTSLEKKLEAYARAFRQTRSGAIEQILAQFLDHDNWVIREVRKGIEAADRAELVSHEDAVRYLRGHAAKRKRDKKAA